MNILFLDSYVIPELFWACMFVSILCSAGKEREREREKERERERERERESKGEK